MWRSLVGRRVMLRHHCGEDPPKTFLSSNCGYSIIRCVKRKGSSGWFSKYVEVDLSVENVIVNSRIKHPETQSYPLDVVIYWLHVLAPCLTCN